MLLKGGDVFFLHSFSLMVHTKRWNEPKPPTKYIKETGHKI